MSAEHPGLHRQTVTPHLDAFVLEVSTPHLGSLVQLDKGREMVRDDVCLSSIKQTGHQSQAGFHGFSVRVQSCAGQHLRCKRLRLGEDLWLLHCHPLLLTNILVGK